MIGSWLDADAAHSDDHEPRNARTASGGPNPTTESVAWLGYVSRLSLGTETTMFELNEDGTYPVWLDFTAADKILVYGGNFTPTTGTATYVGGLNDVFPILFVYNRTAHTTTVFTTKEVIDAVYAAIAVNGRRGFGGGTFNLAPTARLLFDSWFEGAAAEWLTTRANAKAFLQGLGFTIPWS